MAVESVGVGWGTYLLLLILAGGVFCAIFFPCRRAAAKRAAQRRLEALHALDALVLAADHGDMAAQQQLAAEKARLNVADSEYLSYRRVLYTRLAQGGDAFAEYQLGEDARVYLRQPRAAYDHYYRAASLGSVEAMIVFGMLYGTGSDGFELNPALSFQWYLAAARAGSVSAMLEVARCYRTGCGTNVNPAEAAAWAEKAQG